MHKFVVYCCGEIHRFVYDYESHRFYDVRHDVENEMRVFDIYDKSDISLCGKIAFYFTHPERGMSNPIIRVYNKGDVWCVAENTRDAHAKVTDTSLHTWPWSDEETKEYFGIP